MTSKQRLLIVDDERFNRDLLSKLFLADYDVCLAKNGAQALASARETPPPDLILLDIKMPDMDGYEVLRQLRFDEPYCQYFGGVRHWYE
ncbi:MAG: response regulator [Methylococcales bacterium]|nr:response regulator [Methylococcales bacterium]